MHLHLKTDQCISHTADTARRPNVKDATTPKRTEKEAETGRKGAIVSCICREPAAFCRDSLIFSIFLLLRAFHQPKMWRPGNQTQQSTIFLLRLGTAQTNPTDSTFEFSSLWIILIWCEIQLAFHSRNVLQRETFYFIFWLHFKASTLLLLEWTHWISSTSSTVFFDASICTSTYVKNVCAFATSAGFPQNKSLLKIKWAAATLL